MHIGNIRDWHVKNALETSGDVRTEERALRAFTTVEGRAESRVVLWVTCFCIATLGILALALYLLHIRLYDPPRPLANAYYVWQMQWTDSVRDAVTEAAPDADRMMVLLGEVDVKDGRLTFTAAKPDWDTLVEQHAATALVLRANVGMGALLTNGRIEEASEYIHGLLSETIATARAAGVRVVGVQLDYDCPSSKLSDYRRLLDSLRERIGDIDLSITVLPTWLKRWEFSHLVDGLAYYVLQVHSLETPTTSDEPIVLCDTSRIPGYLRRAAWIGVPFYLALPTYGYRVAFDADGKFSALSAEGPTPAWDPGYQVRLVMAEPEAIVKVVQSVMAAPPRGCRGFAWFRLPHSQDELNWSWPTLEAVQEGRVPRAAFDVEIRNPSPDLYEAWLRNTGNMRVWQPVAFDVHWDGHRLVAHDVLGGFHGTLNLHKKTIHLVGPAPHDAEPTMVAWFRTEPEREPTVPFSVSSVEITE